MQAQRNRRASGQPLRRRAAAPTPEFVGDDAGHPVRYGVEERDLRRRRAIANLVAYDVDVDKITAATGLAFRPRRKLPMSLATSAPGLRSSTVRQADVVRVLTELGMTAETLA
jgi:hypothetical protein